MQWEYLLDDSLSPPFSRRIHSSCFFDLMSSPDYIVMFVKEIHGKERWIDLGVAYRMQRR